MSNETPLPKGDGASASLDARDYELDATRLYFESKSVIHPLLNAEQEIYFGRMVVQGDNEARSRMITSNLRLVVKIARRYSESWFGFTRFDRGGESWFDSCG